ncbi:CAP domain-containing protein [Spirulina sp. 06S082]|uniref:CAP domain-containing protein n=1 Tax=Spirulina sp. 06S082 TaxID=3110248 RepID=UPI002B1F9CE2|nr:CAP domain-containing protein [Spirulina sp. 06S082]MEA5471268.1 CAP domain-containing protein [Spirulina sp. 06S082]
MFIKSRFARLPILTLLSFGLIVIGSESVRADVSPLIFPEDNLPDSSPSDRDSSILGQSETENPPPENQNLRAIDILLQLANAEREKVGASPLQLNSQLTEAAQSHAEDMAENDFFSPVNPQGINTEGRVAATGYTGTNMTENLGINRDRPQAILEQWLNSPGYRLSLLNPEYTEAGLGYASNPNSRFKHYWSLILVATGSNNPNAVAPAREILLQEEGELTEEDPSLDVDGSRYDSYNFSGKAGQTIFITLESEEFDTYLFLFDEKNEQIGENDDISEDNKNSQLTIVLPQDGTYLVLVNSYDPNSRGRYQISIKEQDPETSSPENPTQQP